MRETQALIERLRRVSADLVQIDLAVEPSLAQLRPGQGLFVRPSLVTGWDPYLRALLTPIDVQPGRIVAEILAGHPYTPGTVLSVLSPVGRPIPIRGGIRRMLMIAEDTFPTPLLLQARTLISGGVEVTLVLGGTARRYPLELLPPEVEVLHGEEDWAWPDRVETLEWADQVLIVAAPHAQMNAYARLYQTLSQLRHQAIPDGFVLGLFTPRLACAAGVCGACLIPAGEELHACLEGPAVDLKHVRFA